MNTEYSIIEKKYGNHVMSHKPKPLCSCFIGDKMVDMYARFNFDEKCMSCSKVYKGHSSHSNDKDFLDNINVYDGNDEEVNKTIDAIDEYFLHYQLYLH